MAQRILRLADVIRMTGLSRSSISRRERTGRFPLRRDLGGGLIGWVEEEVAEWIEGLPLIGGEADGAGNREDEVRGRSK